MTESWRGERGITIKIRIKIKTQTKEILLRLYRLAMLALIVWVIREHHERVRIKGDSPLKVAEVQSFFTNAAALRLDTGPRQGWEILDANGEVIGYAVRTQPHARKIIGYCGVTDALIVLDPAQRIKGLKVRASEDTIRHVEDVVGDRRFLKKWNGLTWEEAGRMDLQKAGIEGVSGATRTSMAIAESVVHRLAQAGARSATATLQVRARDLGLLCLLGMAVALAFWRFPRYAEVRRAYQMLAVAYIGFVNGDLIAQSLLAGWAKSGVGWQLAPGMTLLVAAALAIPWATRKPWYCQYVCPYGMLQEWAGRLGAKRGWRWQAPARLDAALRRLPAALLVVVVAVVMWSLPLDLAGLEPFDAFLLAGGATLAIAVAGLVAALFVPQAYCRYGCPTGAVLEFPRAHGAKDRFGARDWFALALLLLALGLAWQYDHFAAWLNQ